MHFYRIFTLFLLPSILGAAPFRQESVTGGPRGIHPYLFKSVSTQNLVETARDHQWSINFHKGKNDTLHIIAIRIEFNGGQRDSSELTTGNGLFGIRGGGDKEENEYYNSDTVYKFDSRPHDSLYFSRQLETVKAYYDKVSGGKLCLQYSIYPEGSGEIGYAVPHQMTYYSPGGKKRQETWDDYYYRRSIGLMHFVKDALESAEKNPQNSPFSGLRFEESDNTIRDAHNRKTVFLIFHAGSSYLTDGGEEGTMGQDTPSDFLDAFIDQDAFRYFRDTIGLSSNGITVQGKEPLLIREVMMCSETSNQDGLNWGIQGILVNQIARQIGIPDLFSTTGGISGIGAFCIMDFAGYSAGNGFIPPYPSAWVRAFMGWDKVKVVPTGVAGSYNVKALTSVLDGGGVYGEDTTILMVPLNEHEYYLIENRQRNLSGNKNLFKYDTTDYGVVIASYPYNINIDSNVVSVSQQSGVIQTVRNNDVSLPASGVLVWHVNEQVIRDKLKYNMVNADSSYRGISLIEADGITDLGIMFTDAFYQAAFDYGGAEDVFPHETSIENRSSVLVNKFGPYTRPSTRSNDGGHTYLELQFNPVSSKTPREYMLLARGSNFHKVANFSDSVFNVKINWNYLVPSWPKRAAPGDYFDPLLCELDETSEGKEFVLVSKSGHVYAWSSDKSKENIYNKRSLAVDRVDLRGDTIHNADTIFFLDSIGGVVSMPSAVAGKVMIPSSDGRIYVLENLSSSAQNGFDTIALGVKPSTYICNYTDSLWAAGCSNGRVIFGKLKEKKSVLKLRSDSEVSALAAIGENPSLIAVIQNDGTLSLCSTEGAGIDSSVKVNGIGPYTLVTGDLDRDNSSEIVVCDSRHGVWVYKLDLSLAPGWLSEGVDWATYYTYDTGKGKKDSRSRLPVNLSPPALADINRDGYLDILVSGTNGLYALNYKGVLCYGWPAYLDTRYWYQRGSVMSAPIVVTGADKKPTVVFSSMTGERVTFTLSRVTKADKRKGTIWYTNPDGTKDSIWDLTSSQIDTILDLNDSLIAPYVIPGGLIDAVDENGKRPLYSGTKFIQSSWPLTTGSSPVTGPMAGFTDPTSSPDLFTVSSGGWVYRWRLDRGILPDTLFWPMAGYDEGRSFAFKGSNPAVTAAQKEPIRLFSYPNPTNGSKKAVFRYAFSGRAEKVRLDIFSLSGFPVYSKTTMGNPPSELTGSFPDWNEHIIDISKLGPAVYRCRLEATIAGKKHVKYWKMAVVR